MTDARQLCDRFEQDYLLGNEQVDHIHREFIDLLATALASSGNEFAASFNRLFEHTMLHFFEEEARMEAFSCPTLDEHRNDHQRILGEMDRFNQSVAAGRSTMARAWLNDGLSDWFDLHVRTMDSAAVAWVMQAMADQETING